MFTISIYSPKGGVGRTSISLHLADRLQREGLNVFLNDADPQNSALGFALLAEQSGAPLRFTVGRGTPPAGTDVVVTDHGPQSLPILPRADLHIVPTIADGVSFSVGIQTIERLKAAGAQVLPVASRYRRDRAEHRAALKDEAMINAVVMHDRAALAGFYLTGRLTSDGDQRQPAVRLAMEDIDALTSAVLARMPSQQQSAHFIQQEVAHV